QLSEQTKAGYAMLNFGGKDAEIFGINVVGNAGVRVVQTKEVSTGAASFPNFTNLAALAPCGTPLGVGNVVNPACYLTRPAALPSFNVRFGLTSKDFIRFAYSKAISRPDVGLLRNYVSINSPFINTGPDSPYVVYNSPTAAHVAANVVGYNFLFNSTAGNAGLLPESADQFDLSYERY